jgi:hypothetical protein
VIPLPNTLPVPRVPLRRPLGLSTFARLEFGGVDPAWVRKAPSSIQGHVDDACEPRARRWTDRLADAVRTVGSFFL